MGDYHPPYSLASHDVMSNLLNFLASKCHKRVNVMWSENGKVCRKQDQDVHTRRTRDMCLGCLVRNDANPKARVSDT